jgi:hypothetical protein
METPVLKQWFSIVYAPGCHQPIGQTCDCLSAPTDEYMAPSAVGEARRRIRMSAFSRPVLLQAYSISLPDLLNP